MNGFLTTMLVVSFMASLYAHLKIMDLEEEIKELKTRLEEHEG